MAGNGFFDLERPALEMANKGLRTCNRTDKIEKVIGMMLDKPSYRRLPVLYKGEFHGLVTIIDVLEFLCRKAPTITSTVSRITETDAVAFRKDDTVRDVLETLGRENLGGCPILDGKRPVGMISEWDFAKRIDKKTGIKVRDAMSHPAVVKGSWPVRDVAKLICHGAFRRMPVAEKGILVGVVTPYDILSHLHKKGRLGKLRLEKAPVEKVLPSRLVTIGPDADIRQAVQKMEKNRVGGLPVEHDQELLGFITERDVLEVVA